MSGRRICVGHDHLRNQGREDRQEERARQSAGECRNVNRHGVDRDAQPVQSDRGLVDHRSGAEESPVQTRAGQPLEVDPVGPVGGLHLGQIDAAAAGRIEIEERRTRQKPADRLLRRGKRVHVR